MWSRNEASFLQWMYEARLPHGCANYIDISRAFIEVVGQCGPRMKPPVCHEIGVNYQFQGKVCIYRWSPSLVCCSNLQIPFLGNSDISQSTHRRLPCNPRPVNIFSVLL
uniref:Putative ovule protein n=1 Tax=Solanum chacoense TaxID=4108 RepID=A0A0V0HMU7_SOLCH